MNEFDDDLDENGISTDELLRRINLGLGVPSKDLQEKFEKVKQEWLEWHSTRYSCSLHEMFAHPAYLRMIGLGKNIIPYLIKELKTKPDWWFPALAALTGENEIPINEYSGGFSKYTKIWLDWAEKAGYSNIKI